MSSNFQIGLPESQTPKKSSHRTAHTDIFGSVESTLPTPKKGAPESNMKNLLAEETDGTKIEESKPEKENKTENVKTEQPAAFHRVRMPPGGFSSGLW